MAQYKPSETRKLQKLKKEYHKQDPTCKNCGVVTVIYRYSSHADNTATIQHLKPKGHPERKGLLEDTELWCHKCNQRDNNGR